MTSSTDSKRVPPPTLQGRYRLVRTLEEGKRGTTFLGYDVRLHRWRAIDVPVDETTARRLSLEAELLAKLEHPALERVVDLGEDGPISFVVRDRLQGSATTHLPMRPAVAGFVVQRIADGLSHAHARGILHGHLRPSVIRFSDDGAPVLTGFGDAPKVNTTASGRLAEGWAHLAPEVREGRTPDVAAEIYSLGALLYTLVAGRHQADLSYAEAYDGLLAGIPAPLRPVILRTCAHDPAQRPSDADAFRALLGVQMERLGSLGDLPWRSEALPEFPPELITPDLGVLGILTSLGPRPAAGSRPRTLDVEPASTMDTGWGRGDTGWGRGDTGSGRGDTGSPGSRRAGPRRTDTGSEASARGTPKGGGYSMPEIYRKDPGFRDPFQPLDVGDIPEYVDPHHAQDLLLRRPTRVTVTPTGTQQRHGPQGSSAGAGPMLAIAMAVMIGVATVVGLSAAGVVAYWGWEAHQDNVFVQAVLAERTVAGDLADTSADPEKIQSAWFRLNDEPTPEHAAEFVRLVAPLSERPTTPDEVRTAVDRLEAALDAWQR